MKLIWCDHCNTLTSISKKFRTCQCGKFGGKYLDDNITVVVNEGSIIVGIDNNTFLVHSLRNYKHLIYNKVPERIDMFFTGWIPNIPGEVIFVKSKWKARRFFGPYNKTNSSTMPTKS
jgi:hypothetical protein